MLAKVADIYMVFWAQSDEDIFENISQDLT